MKINRKKTLLLVSLFVLLSSIGVGAYYLAQNSTLIDDASAFFIRKKDPVCGCDKAEDVGNVSCGGNDGGPFLFKCRRHPKGGYRWFLFKRCPSDQECWENGYFGQECKKNAKCGGSDYMRPCTIAGQTKCDNNILLKCENGTWTPKLYCDSLIGEYCHTTLGCVGLTPTAKPKPSNTPKPPSSCQYDCVSKSTCDTYGGTQVTGQCSSGKACCKDL